jgi:hypothetical protein
MLTAAVIAAAVAAVGMIINLFMVMVAIRRRERVVKTAPNDVISRLTVARTVRNELTFLLTQGCVFVASMSAVATVGEQRDGAFSAFVTSAIARCFVSMLLLSQTLYDLLDRHRIHDALNEENADQMLLKAKRMGIDVSDLELKRKR